MSTVSVSVPDQQGHDRGPLIIDELAPGRVHFEQYNMVVAGLDRLVSSQQQQALEPANRDIFQLAMGNGLDPGDCRYR